MEEALRHLNDLIDQKQRQIDKLKKYRQTDHEHWGKQIQRLEKLAFDLMRLPSEDQALKENCRQTLIELGMCDRCWSMYCLNHECINENPYG